MIRPATPDLAPAQPSQPADGRRERSRSSRSKIVSAMLELVRGGDPSPSAARVAEVAGVGVRSVFRHFADMETLYREMSDALEGQVRPLIQQAPVGATWKDKMVDIARRRSQVFETLLPYRVSASLRRFQSPYLMGDYNRLLALEFATIQAHVPPEVAANHLHRHSLYLVLSFQTWRALRHDQGLEPNDAKAVLLNLLDRTLSNMPGA